MGPLAYRDKHSRELLKLGIAISKGCVADILLRNGLRPAPDRKGLTWRQFLARHADVVLCADFLTEEVWTLTGLQTAYIFFVIHLRPRRVLLARATFSHHSDWVEQQMRNVLWECDSYGIQPRFLLHSNDSDFSASADRVLKNASVTPVRTPQRAPNANAYAERWIRSLRQECLDHLVHFGLRRLQRVLDQYREFFNVHRPHQGIGNRVPGEVGTETPVPVGSDLGAVECDEFLGSLLKSYRRAA